MVSLCSWLKISLAKMVGILMSKYLAFTSMTIPTFSEVYWTSNQQKTVPWLFRNLRTLFLLSSYYIGHKHDNHNGNHKHVHHRNWIVY